MNIGVNQQIIALKQRDDLPVLQLEKLVKRQKAVTSIAGSGLMYQDLSLAEILLAKRYGYFSPEGRKLLEDSYKHIQKGIELSPARSIGWTRLAYIKLLLEEPSKDVADIINMAIILEPDNFDSMYFRIQLAMSVWQYCTEDQKELIRQQIRLGWHKHMWRTLSLVKNKISYDIVDEAMRESGDYEKFIKRVKKY